MEADLAGAYERCRALHKQHGRTYYLATRLLPAWKRRHVHALYGFTRYADEIVLMRSGTVLAHRIRHSRWAQALIRLRLATSITTATWISSRRLLQLVR